MNHHTQTSLTNTDLNTTIQLAVKDCQLITYPSVMLSHVHGDIWAAEILLQAWRGKYRLKFPFRFGRISHNRDLVPCTHEVVQAFRSFKTRLLDRDLIPILESRCISPSEADPEELRIIPHRISFVTPSQVAQAA